MSRAGEVRSRDGFAGMGVSGADLRGGSAGPLANKVFPKGPDAGGCSGGLEGTVSFFPGELES